MSRKYSKTKIVCPYCLTGCLSYFKPKSKKKAVWQCSHCSVILDSFALGARISSAKQFILRDEKTILLEKGLRND